MKKLILIAGLIASQVSFAQIKNSQNTARHQSLIAQAIEQNCGSMRNLTEITQAVEVIRVDQGITDKKFTTVLTGEQRLDQNMFDTYKIVVQSEYADMYDHNSQDWGAYFVTSVSCEMAQ